MRVRVIVGLNYSDPLRPGAEKRAEPGAEVSDLPPQAIPDLIAQGAVELLEEVRRGKSPR